MTKNPEVSICIPSYNSERFLRVTIDSVMRQGLADFELLLVDNASEDGTKALILSLRNPRIRYIRNPCNVGSRENHNICIANANGTYIKFLCADDKLIDGVLGKQLDILRRHREIALVTCNHAVTDINLNIIRDHSFYPGLVSGSRVIDVCLGSMTNHIGGPSNVMFRRTAVEGLRMDSTYRWVADLKWWMQILERGDFANIDEVGYLYRRHSEAESIVGVPEDIRAGEYLRLMKEFDRWSAFACVAAVRRGAEPGRALALRHFWNALGPTGLCRSIRTGIDILNARGSVRRKM
jgi:glycosyltransferase involved in cell wall biosynthesis